MFNLPINSQIMIPYIKTYLSRNSRDFYYCRGKPAKQIKISPSENKRNLHCVVTLYKSPEDLSALHIPQPTEKYWSCRLEDRFPVPYFTISTSI